MGQILERREKEKTEKERKGGEMEWAEKDGGRGADN